eukprot:m.68870 g.68870  ORF g.68870 m.68870 type:complete len:57 (-) comp7775_c0_seq1:1971-2141(-)
MADADTPTTVTPRRLHQAQGKQVDNRPSNLSLSNRSSRLKLKLKLNPTQPVTSHAS